MVSGEVRARLQQKTSIANDELWYSHQMMGPPES